MLISICFRSPVWQKNASQGEGGGLRVLKGSAIFDHKYCETNKDLPILCVNTVLFVINTPPLDFFWS